MKVSLVSCALAISILLGGMQLVAQSMDYYVATTGSDSKGDGSASNPWATIAHADSIAQPGWTVHVAPGTYTGNLDTTHSGSASLRITFISDTKWGAVLKPSSSSDHWNNGGSYVTIQDFEFDGTGSDSSDAIAAWPLNGQHDQWVIGNKLHDYAGNCNHTGDAVITTTGGGVSNAVIEGNLIYHNNCGRAGSTPNSSGMHGIYSAGSGDTIQNNIVVDQGGGWCIHSWHQASNTILANNTVANCGQGGFLIGNDGSGSPSMDDYTSVINNISVDNVGPSYGFTEEGNTGSHNFYSNNLAYGNATGNFYLQNGLTASSTQTGSDSTTFVNYTGAGSGDYHLKAGSTAIDNGTNSCASGVSNCAPTTDFDENSRPVNGLWDIGAHEYEGSVSPPTGLTAVIK